MTQIQVYQMRLHCLQILVLATLPSATTNETETVSVVSPLCFNYVS